jgi:hypothetical protein
MAIGAYGDRLAIALLNHVSPPHIACPTNDIFDNYGNFCGWSGNEKSLLSLIYPSVLENMA